MFAQFLDIIFKSIKLDKNLYKNPKYFGEAAIYFAGLIMILDGVAGAVAAGRGLANNNNNAEPPAQEGPGGGAADVTAGSDNVNVPPPVNRWYSLYLEGFPVPQQPGWLLDALSVVMAFCASLKPGWDPRPVNPHFFRDIFHVGAAGAGAGAGADVNAGQG